MDPGITKFNDFTAIDTNDVVMLVIAVRLFELSHIFPKLMFGNQVTGNKQLQCVVHCSPANPVFLVFHMDVEGLYIEVIISGINFL